MRTSLKSASLLVLFSLILLGCEAAKETVSDTSNALTGGVTTLRGVLSVQGLPLSAAKQKGFVRSQSTDCTGQKAALYNLDTKTETIVDINADCSFSATVGISNSYSVNFIDDNYRFIGSLVADPNAGGSGANSLYIGLLTSSGSDTNLGSIILSTIDHAASASSLTADMVDSRFVASAINGIPAGLLEGNGNLSGSNNMDFSNIVPDFGMATDGTDPDADNDGVLDIMDSDNNNNGIKDDIEGVGSTGMDGGGCEPLDRMTLFTNNKVPASSIIAGIANTTDSYVITIHMHPRTGYNVNAVSVSGPSYISEVHAWFDNEVHNPPAQWGWDGNLLWRDAEGGSFTAWIGGISQSDAAMHGTEPLNLGQSMSEGDVLVFTVMADNTAHTCTKKINGVFREVPKDVAINNVPDSTTGATWTNISIQNGVTFTWDIADMVSLGWSGLDYYIELWSGPYSGRYPTDDLNAATICKRDPGASYTDITTLTVPQECLPGYSNSAVNWQFDIAASKNNNSAYQGGRFTTQSAYPPQ